MAQRPALKCRVPTSFRADARSTFLRRAGVKELDDGKIYRKALYLMVKTMMFPVDFPSNQPNDGELVGKETNGYPLQNLEKININWKWIENGLDSGKQTVIENLSCMNHAYVIILWKLADEFPLWYKASSSRGVSIAMFDYRRAQEMIFGDWQYEHWKPFSSYGFQKKVHGTLVHTHTPSPPPTNIDPAMTWGFGRLHSSRN